jgi:hypothetical protein
VLGYLSLPDKEQPKLLAPLYGTADGVIHMIRSMVILLTTLMQPSVNGEDHKDILELRTRIFLNAVDDFERPLRKKKDDQIKVEFKRKEAERKKKEEEYIKRGRTGKKPPRKTELTLSAPVWLDKYNFLSLLNLPEVIREFGSPRNYFEGKYLGEQFVQEVKNMRERCPPKHVLPNLLRKLHEGKSIESMATMHQSKKLQTMRLTESVHRRDPVRKEILGSNVRVYPSMESVSVSFYSKAVMSLVGTQEKGFGILFYGNGNKRGKILFCHVERLDLQHLEMHGIRYWKWVLLPGENLLHDLTIIDYVVLLPKSVLDNDVIPGEYTMVTKEWSPAMLDNYEYSLVGMDQKVSISVCFLA